MRAFIGIFFIMTLAMSSQAQEKQWTLRECIEYALENNISIKQSELNLEAAKIDKLDAIGNFIPSLNGQAQISENTGASINPVTNAFENDTFTSFTTGFSSGLTLFDGWRNVHQLQRAKLNALAGQYSLDKMKDDISLFVANAYLQVLFNKETVNVLMAQNEITGQQLERTQELVDAGSLPSGDLLEIRATNADERQRIIVAQNNVRIALVSLAQTLLIKDYDNFQIAEDEYNIIDDGLLDKNVNVIIAQAEEERNEVKLAQQNLDIAEKDVKIAKGAYLPTLSAFFQYNTRWADNDFFERDFTTQLYENDGLGYGLQLNVPILNGFATRNSVKRSKINALRAEYNLEQAKLDLESNVYQAYVDAQGAKEAYESALVAVESQSRANEYARERFDVGLTNAFDFSQSKIRLQNAEIEAKRTKFDYIFKLKVLELYFGVPASELKF